MKLKDEAAEAVPQYPEGFHAEAFARVQVKVDIKILEM